MNHISIIIPVLNEAATLPSTLLPLQTEESVEIIVVDGGSDDYTVEIGKSLGVQVLQSERGKGKQMNAGANAATGEILLFLHGDTQLPQGFAEQVRQTLNTPGTVGGAFELKIDASLPGLRWIERMVNWRSHFLQMPYGDQALFVKATTFKAMGGFPEIAIMEDFEFVRHLQRRGQIKIVKTAVTTSGRRWQKFGILRTTVINQVMILGYFLGVSPTQLAQWYRGQSR